MPRFAAGAQLEEAAAADLRRAASSHVCLIHVHGRRASPPRLEGLWTLTVGWEDLAGEFTRPRLLKWLSAVWGAEFSRIYDFSASHPCGARIEWQLPTSAQVWLFMQP